MSRIFKLSEVMRSQTVTITDDGYEMESIAGKAFYSVSGLRGKVNGIPEYFPISLCVKNERRPVEPKVEQSKAPPSLDEQVAAQAAQISNRGSSITKLTSDLAETNASITQKSTSCVGAMTSLPFSVLASSVNELHIDSARINKGSISEAHICGNTIEQETLSAVLVHFLPTTNLDKASEHAVKLASAVKASFNELNATTSNAITDQNGAKRFATGTLSSGDRPDTASGRLSSNWSIKTTGGIQTLECRNFVVGIDPADKPDSTVKVKLELDTSDFQKAFDKLSKLLSESKIFGELKQDSSDAASSALAARISLLENRVNSLIADVTRLENSFVSFHPAR